MLKWIRDRFVRKSIHDAVWQNVDATTEKSTGNVSIEASRALSRSLSPTECYELSIAVHRAVNSIAGNISQAEWRMFTKSGREITGGPLFELIRRPSPRISRRKLVYQMIAWACISGEFAVRLGENLDSLMVLNPYRLRQKIPAKTVASRDDVIAWEYRWCDGAVEQIRDDHLIFDAMFNPNIHEPVRGLSPLVTGSVQVSASYQAARYNKQFFENNAVPSHLLVLPEGIGRASRQEIERKYQAEFSAWHANAHKVFVVAGAGDAEFKSIEQPIQEGAFMELQKWSDQKIGQLFGVPPIEMQIYDKTRFDSAPMERQSYVESVLAPMMDRIADVFEWQLIEPHFRFSDVTTEQPRMTKRLGAEFEKARANRATDSPIVLMVDADTLPIMAQVKAAQIEQAQKFRDTLHMSAREVAEYFKLDIPERDEREDVWVANTYSNITRPEKNPAYWMQQNAAAQDTESRLDGSGTNAVRPGGEKGEEKDEEEKPPMDKAQVKQAEKFLRRLRRLTMERMETGAVWSLSEADALAAQYAPDCDLRLRVRRLRHAIRTIIAAFPPDQRKDEVKFLLNDTSGKELVAA